MPQVRTALIIGAGIAGSVAAATLRRTGVAATVYEAYPALADGLGGTLTMTPNGIAALETAGLRQSVSALATPIERSVMSTGHKHLDLPGVSGMPPLQVVHRKDLLRLLHDHAVDRGVTYEYGKRLVRVDDAPNGITATFADGTDASAEILVGADGIHSTVRGLIDPHAPKPKPTGVLGFEGITDHPVDAEPATVTFAFGRRAYYLYWPKPGGGTAWGVNLPRRGPVADLDPWSVSPADWMRMLQEALAGEDPGGELMLTTSPEDLQVYGALEIMPPVPHWYRGRMVLVGDSVHAPSPTSGQGASLAIESAVQLARCVRDITGIDAAFAAYEGLRRERVEKVAARAAKINHAKAPGAAVRSIMPVLMPLLMKTVMDPERTLAAEQQYRIDWSSTVTAQPSQP